MPARKGQRKAAGRQRGTPNKRTVEVKRALEDFTINFLDNKVLPPVVGNKKSKTKKSRLQNVYEKLYDRAVNDGDVKAAQELLDRGWGKPKAFVNFDDSTSISDVTKDEIDELHKRMVKK